LLAASAKTGGEARAADASIEAAPRNSELPARAAYTSGFRVVRGASAR
jgi:hypothetical protein